MEAGGPRRSFFPLLINVLGAAMASVVAFPAAAYLLLKPKSGESEDLVEIADVAQLRPGEPEEVVYFRTRVDGWKRVREKATAWVVKKDEESVTAFAPQCTHLGCAFHWESDHQSFVCPCHSSAFGLDGEVLAGPAPRPLDRYASRIDRGRLLIHPSIERKPGRRA
jgi:menaquinol-cytochrome c reductase iron-sulfur subunit